MLFERSTLSTDTGTTSTAAPATSSTTSSTSTAPAPTAPTSTGSTAPGAIAAAQATQGVGTYDIPILTRYAGVPIAGPALVIPAGATIEVMPYDGNTVKAFVSMAGPTGAQNGPRMPFPVGSANPRTVNIRNLCELWVYSPNVGEGVQVTIKYAHS